MSAFAITLTATALPNGDAQTDRVIDVASGACPSGLALAALFEDLAAGYRDEYAEAYGLVPIGSVPPRVG